MPFIACKLPQGLEINHNGRTIVLKGANIGEKIKNPSDNGSPDDNRNRMYGFGITELGAADAAAFQDWSDKARYVNGVGGKDGVKLAFPFPALENGAILGPFASKSDLEQEVNGLYDSITTGFEGLDPEAEGVEKGSDEDEAETASKSTRKK